MCLNDSRLRYKFLHFLLKAGQRAASGRPRPADRLLGRLRRPRPHAVMANDQPTQFLELSGLLQDLGCASAGSLQPVQVLVQPGRLRSSSSQ
jgi:hypothetical protein